MRRASFPAMSAASIRIARRLSDLAQQLQRGDSHKPVNPRTLAGIALVLTLLCTSAQAQFVGGSSFNGTDSLVATWSGTGDAVSVGFAALANDQHKPYINPPPLQNLGGVVQVILKSSTDCKWVMPDYRWTLVPNSEAEADGLCQVLYYRTFQKDERPPYRFRWFKPLTYDVRTYVISNVSGVDVASNNGGKGNVLTADGVATTAVGDYLMAFYASLGSGTWAPPANMGIAVRNDYAYTGPANFPNLATQAWAYPAALTGNKVAIVSGSPTQWVADLVAFKPLYRIPLQAVSDINPGPVYNGCKGKVTLSQGEGTFRNPCIRTTSFCQCRDTTKVANSCYTGNPKAGSVALTGTGDDVELVNCI